MKFKFIQSNRGSHKLGKMCKALSVSASGYHDFIKRQNGEESDKKRLDREIVERIHFHFFDNYRCYGSPRIHRLLLDEGYKISERTVGKRMKTLGLRASSALFKTPTTDSDHDRPVYEDLLRQNFEVSGPNQVWVTDITYIATDEGFLYVNIILDLYGRKLISHRAYDHMKTALCLNTLQEAIEVRQPPPGLIHHSDRGSQYCSRAYTDELKRIGARISMSRTATPYDNACSESFFASMKKEFVYHRKYKTKEEALVSINEYIYFYNNKRMHSSLGYLTPREFEMGRIASQ